MTEETHPKTLYVGNLDLSVTEDLLSALFGEVATVKSCKIIRKANVIPYAFIEYDSHQSAQSSLEAMNNRVFLKKEIIVNWATSPGNQPRADISHHHHIFVGDLSPETDTESLRKAFAPFGEISNCRIVRDPQTYQSKGYAFVSFVKKSEAEKAIEMMNGQLLGSRNIRTNWSIWKPRSLNFTRVRCSRTPSFEEIYYNTGPTNTTVYCGGFPSNTISDNVIKSYFGQFGLIHDVRVFKNKGYAFIRFTSKEAAARAIEITHNSEVQGHPVKCYWGRENGGEMANNYINATAIDGPRGDSQLQNTAAAAARYHVANRQQAAAAAAAEAQYHYPAYGQMGYWYPSYPQMQAQYIQQNYGYPYTYSAGSPHLVGTGDYRMTQPNMAAGWGMQSLPEIATNRSAAIESSSQQPMMYPTISQFQTQ